MADSRQMGAVQVRSRSRAKRFAFEMLCTVLSFLLVFNLSFSLQYAFADDDGGSGSETGEIGGGESGGGGTEEPEPPARYVDDLQAILEVGEDNTTIGYASTGVVTAITLDKMGQRAVLHAYAIWNDDKSDKDPVGREYSSSDSNIVTIDPSGNMVARGDGDATITVSLTRNTASGSPISLKIPVHVTNQTGKNISEIKIYSDEYPDKDPIIIADKPKEKVYLQFYAVVTLGDGTVYDTKNGPLSSQDPQLEDLAWYLSDEQMGVVEPKSGEYRAREYGSTAIFAMSSDFVRSNTITVNVVSGDEDPDGHPQPELTVEISYEEEIEGAIKIENQVFDVGDLLSQFGSMTRTYTLTNGKGGASQSTGYGVPLRAFLLGACKVAGKDSLDAIASVTFRSGVDKQNTTMSISELFATRYTYDPYSYVTGIYSAIGTTEPMLAIESNWMDIYAAAGGRNSDMTNRTQFRLLMGSRSDRDSVTGASIKWINKVEIVLSGGPPVPDKPKDEPDPDPDPPESGGGGTGEGGSGGSGVGSSVGLAGSGTGSGDNEGSGVQSNTVGSKSGAYSIYQVMNPFETDLEIEYAENPFKPFVLPLCLAFIAAGLTQAGFWYRRQRQPLSVGGVTMAKGTA